MILKYILKFFYNHSIKKLYRIPCLQVQVELNDVLIVNIIWQTYQGLLQLQIKEDCRLLEFVCCSSLLPISSPSRLHLLEWKSHAKNRPIIKSLYQVPMLTISMNFQLKLSAILKWQDQWVIDFSLTVFQKDFQILPEFFSLLIVKGAEKWRLRLQEWL